MEGSQQPVPVEGISEKILTVRGRKIILGFDLAEMYGVPTKRLNEQVKRNMARFPSDFMFQLSREETSSALETRSQTMHERMNRSQIATGSQKHRDPRFKPYAFTEHGAAMATNVLNSPRAIEMSIFIIRAFILMRQMLLDSRELRRELDELKRLTNDRFHAVFETLDHLLAVEEKPKRKIGFTAKEQRAAYALQK